MITRFSNILKVSLLLTWLLPMDKSEHTNRHLTSRYLYCFSEEGAGLDRVKTGIELTSNTFSGNFTVNSEENRTIHSVKFTLKIFNISVETFEKINVNEKFQLSNIVDLEVKMPHGELGKFKNLTISDLLGLNEHPAANSNSVENKEWRSFKENYEPLLKDIKVNLCLHFKRLDPHNYGALQKISIEMKFTKPEYMFKAGGVFPFELDIKYIWKMVYNTDLSEKRSKQAIDSESIWDEFSRVEDNWINQTKVLLKRVDLAPICYFLDTLRDQLKSYKSVERRMHRYQHILSDFYKEPKSFKHYYFEGLMKVYDPFRSTREYYLYQPEAEEKRPSMCSELLIPHLKSLVVQGEEMLGNLQKKLSDGMGLFTGNSKVTETLTVCFLKMFLQSVESKWEKDCVKRDFLGETNRYFEKIIKEYQSNQDKPELTGNPNPLQSLDVIFKKLSESPKNNSIRSVEDCFSFFSLGQGRVLTNYLKLCFAVTEKNWILGIQFPSFQMKKEPESLKSVKNPMLELITDFYEFLRLEEVRERQSEPKKMRLGFDQVSKSSTENIDAFFKIVRDRCAKSYYMNKPFNGLGGDDYKIVLSEETLKEDAQAICKIMVENLEKIVGPSDNEDDDGVLVKFCDVLIRECFDTHYGNFRKIEDASTLLIYGAHFILKGVLEKLKKEKNDERNEEVSEQLQHLIVIDELIKNLLNHSKCYHYFDIVSSYYSDMSTVAELVCNAQKEVGCFNDHASIHNNAIQKDWETSSESSGDDDGQDYRNVVITTWDKKEKKKNTSNKKC